MSLNIESADGIDFAIICNSHKLFALTGICLDNCLNYNVCHQKFYGILAAKITFLPVMEVHNMNDGFLLSLSKGGFSIFSIKSIIQRIDQKQTAITQTTKKTGRGHPHPGSINASEPFSPHHPSIWLKSAIRRVIRTSSDSSFRRLPRTCSSLVLTVTLSKNVSSTERRLAASRIASE